MTKMLFMLTLLLLSAQSHAQFTGAVWSGTRVLPPAGGEYITLPGCSTLTEVGFDTVNLVFDGGSSTPCNGENITSDTVYTAYNCGSGIGCMAPLYFVANIGTSLYVTVFTTTNNFSTYSSIYGPTLLIAPSQSVYVGSVGISPYVTGIIRVVFTYSPVTNPCPSESVASVFDLTYTCGAGPGGGP